MNTIFTQLKNDALHPLKFADNQHKSNWSARWIIGWGIPIFAAVILTTLAFGAFCGIIHPPKVMTQNLTNDRISRLEADIQDRVKERSQIQSLSDSIDAVEKKTQALQIQIEELLSRHNTRSATSWTPSPS